MSLTNNGRSFENVKNTLNFHSSKENLNNKISQLLKKFVKKVYELHEYTYNNNQSKELPNNFEAVMFLQNFKKMKALLEAFLSKKEQICNTKMS